MTTIEQMFEKYEQSDYQPTCENLVVHFAGILKKHLPPELKLFSLKLQETETSFAEWYSADN